MFDMIGNVFKNLTSKPATRKYPFEKRPSYKNTRGSVGGVGIDDCIFCGICSKKCPSDAIEVKKAEKSWEIDPFKCVICGACAEVCPKKCIYMDEKYTASAYKKGKLKFVQQPKPVDKAKQETAQN
jgi:ech hydrogenase subunit F